LPLLVPPSARRVGSSMRPRRADATSDTAQEENPRQAWLDDPQVERAGGRKLRRVKIEKGKAGIVAGACDDHIHFDRGAVAERHHVSFDALDRPADGDRALARADGSSELISG